MANKKLDRAKFEEIILKVVDRYNQAQDSSSKGNLWADITNQRDDFAQWFHQQSGVKVSGKYHHEKVLSPARNTSSDEAFFETPASKELLAAYIGLGDGKQNENGTGDYEFYLFQEKLPSVQLYVLAAVSIPLIVLCGLLALVPLGLWQSASLKGNPALENTGVLHAFQFFLMLIFAISVFFMEKARLDRIPKGKQLLLRKTLGQLFLGLKGVWGSFALLYFWLSISAFLFPAFALNEAISDFLNACGSAFFFFLFLVMDQESFPPQDHSGSLKKFRQFLGLGMIVIALVVGLSMIDRAQLFGKADTIFTVIYSFVMAVPYIYFFGRLDSHYFQANRLALAPLYLYGIIQSIWSGLLSDEIQPVVFVAALVLKIYFFGFVWFHLREGNFEGYFKKMHSLYRN